MNTIKLLILDDDPMIASTMHSITEVIGAQARMTLEPEAFFAELEQWQPSHVCIDLNMPMMDGLEVIRALAQRHCQAQIIIGSGVGMRVLEAAALAAREQGLLVAGVLSKPFTLKALRDLLVPAVAARQVAVALVAAHQVARSAAPIPAFIVDAQAIQTALVEGQFRVVYQPKTRCADGRLYGVEALARWQHPEMGLIMPDRFIPLAEQWGLIDDLTLHVAEQALRWFMPWTASRPGLEDAVVSINLSAKSLGSKTVVERLYKLCVSHGTPPHRVIFELTESAAMEDPGLALELLTRLRVLGFKLSIDDFGTGFSSMVQLVRLPFSELKVDKSFVINFKDSQESRTIIRFTVDLARSLGLLVTAEGVEDQDALDYLKLIGCDFAQGYFVGRPMSGQAMSEWWQAAQAKTLPSAVVSSFDRSAAHLLPSTD